MLQKVEELAQKWALEEIKFRVENRRGQMSRMNFLTAKLQETKS